MIQKATMADAAAISDLVNSYASRGLMLSKSEYDVYKNILSFIVFKEGEITNKLLGGYPKEQILSLLA